MREFKFYPEDFKELSVKVKHMDLVFDIFDDHTKAISDLHLKAKEDLSEIELNAKNLEIITLRSDLDLEYNYDESKDLIFIKFAKVIPAGTDFTIHTETICKPTKNILEGLYYDETPGGAPPTQITQCQQYGFQRIVPCIDDMTAKCTYKTKIIADSRYTHMITNGDIVQEKTDLGNGRSEIVYENKITPMATYLTFIGVGTYDAFKRDFIYPDGKKFVLELLTFPGTDKEAAERALDILYYSIAWIYVYTGPKRYENIEKKNDIFKLMINKKSQDANEIAKGLTFGYKYTGTVYREIAMQNSNFGGMENVGNTTITSNRMLPSKETTDNSFAYIMEVKEHEFYHNLNGSEVTGWSPFEFWLNEAVTCHVEAQYLSFIAGPEYARLSNLMRILYPHGTFEEDSGTMAMPIIPKGFNTPDELISGVTYSKSPEFVNMVELLMGKENFAKALDNYHIKFSHGNAKYTDWIKCMEEVAEMDFSNMAEKWLKQTGFPTVKIKASYNKEKNSCSFELKQNGDWEFPFVFAIFDKEGNKLRERMIHIKETSTSIQVDDINVEPGFYSFNRNFSFYGKIDYDASEEELYLQAEKDDDIVARYIAYYTLADKEKSALVEDIDFDVDEKFLSLYHKILNDERLLNKVGARILSNPESVEDQKKTHMYEELYQAKKKLRLTIAEKFEEDLLKIYEDRKDWEIDAPYVEKEFFNIKNRQVKNLVLTLLAELDTPKIHKLIKQQLYGSNCATDRNAALSLYLNSSAADRKEVFNEFKEKMKQSLVSWEQLLAIVASSDADDLIDLVKELKASKDFRIEQSNDQRSLLMQFAFNKRKSLLTSEGRELLKEILIELAPINEYNVNHIISVFAKLDDMQEKYWADLVGILQDLLGSLDKEKFPSVYNQVLRLLKGAPKAVANYKKLLN